MVMGVFAEIRNGFECFCKCKQFCFPDLGKEKLGSILVFGNVCFNIVVRVNHDDVASRGAVGRARTIARLQTRTRRKDGTENFGGFVNVLDGFLQRDFVLWVFMCLINIRVSLFRLPRRGLPRPTCLSFPATTPRATTPHLYRTGYHACVYISRLSRHSLILLLGYHTRAITLHHTRKSGYHTRHSCLLYTSPSPRDKRQSRMPSSA